MGFNREKLMAIAKPANKERLEYYRQLANARRAERKES